MRRDDPVRKRSVDWPSYDRTDRTRGSSPKGSFASRGEGGSRQGYEASWSSRFDTDPKQSSDKQLGGWREPSRSGRQDLASASSGRSETAIKQPSSGLEGSGTDSLAWSKTSSSSVRWGNTPRSPIVPPPSIAPLPSRPSPSVPPPLSHPPSSLPPPPSSLPPRPQGPQSRAGRVSTPSGTSVTTSEEAQRSSTEHDKVATGPKSAVYVPEDRRKHYWSRLALLSEAILLRNEYNQVARTLELRRKLQNSSGYAHVSENVQSKLNGFAQEYEDKGKELKIKLEKIFSKLVEADMLANGTSDEVALAMDQASLSHLQTRLGQLDDKVQKLTVEASRWNSQTQEQRDEHLSAGQKRPPDSLPDGRVENNAEILQRLDDLEAHLFNMDNQVMQQTENFMETLEARLDTKMKNLGLGASDTKERGSMATGMTGAHSEAKPAQAGDSLQEQLAKLTQDHEEFAEETANLITKHAQASADIHRLQEENVALKQALSKYQSSLLNVQGMVDRNERQVQALIAAVKVIRDQSSQPPPQMDIDVLDPIRKRVLQDVLSSVNTALLSFREQCEEALLSTQEETLKQIMAKFAPTMDLVNIIFSRSLETENIPSE